MDTLKRLSLVLTLVVVMAAAVVAVTDRGASPSRQVDRVRICAGAAGVAGCLRELYAWQAAVTTGEFAPVVVRCRPHATVDGQFRCVWWRLADRGCLGRWVISLPQTGMLWGDLPAPAKPRECDRARHQWR